MDDTASTKGKVEQLCLFQKGICLISSGRRVEVGATYDIVSFKHPSKNGGKRLDLSEAFWTNIIQGKYKSISSLSCLFSCLFKNFLFQGQFCDYCNAADPNKAHPITNAVDGTERWWQSPSLSQGLNYDEVNVTLDLGQVSVDIVDSDFSLFYPMSQKKDER